ncbi:ferredoxin [Pseudomonas phage KPP21]|uniref:Uncharacterized protein n=1 Tax=Pseudomonas phage KPP21 TaxID=1678082 RepID=A0A0H5B3A7_BPK21|nr:ferredoxin [Pseudomonas phage KPP21]BAR94642.1 hypothetical protein [Pseudomonas phage KPP21]
MSTCWVNNHEITVTQSLVEVRRDGVLVHECGGLWAACDFARGIKHGEEAGTEVDEVLRPVHVDSQECGQPV